MFRRLLIKHVIRSQIRLNSTELSVSKNIKIPNKIYRNELSVLKAMANCVEISDGTSLHCLIDEPWLYPNDYSIRKRFMLSKASGKLSARMAFNDIKHEFIKVALDEPKIKCLLPLLSSTDIIKKVEAGELSIEKGLQLMTNLLKPKDAWDFYDANKSTVFSESTLQSLLELFCATAGSEMTFDTPAEELYFSATESVKWRLDNSAELLFNALPDKTRSAYEAMIRGASKYQDPSRALELFADFRQKFASDFPGLATCNAMLRSLHYLESADDEVEQHIRDILQAMSDRNIAPSVISFNNAIYAFSARKNMDFVEALYQEMLALDIEPSLGTFAVLLRCNYPKVYLLSLARDVVDVLESRRETIDFEPVLSPDDCDLFRTMMELFRSTSAIDLALRLHEVVMTGGRIHLLDSDAKRGNYSDNFTKLLLLCANDDLALVLARVRELVPHYYLLQPSTVAQLVDQARNQRAYRQIPALLNIVNWNNRRHVETDSFGRILELLLDASDFEADDKLRNDLARSLERLLEMSRTRRESAISNRHNALMVIEVVSKRIEDRRELLWKYVEFALQQRLMTATGALPLVEGAVRWQEWLAIEKLVAYLAADDEPLSVDEARAMRQIVQFCNERALPLLEKNGVDTSPVIKHLEQCAAAADAVGDLDDVDSSSSSSSSESSDDEDDDR